MLETSAAAAARTARLLGSVRRMFWRFSAFAMIAAGGVAHAGPLVTVGANFAGCNINTCGSIPPDTDGAVGPDHFVEFLNGGYSVYDKSGMLLQRSDSFSFWRSAGVTPGAITDPRVLYDPVSGRWFAAELDLPSTFLLGRSNTSDPTQGWQAVRMTPNPNSSVDFTRLGLNQNGVYLSAFSNGNVLIAVPKADLLGPTPTAAKATVFTNIPQSQTGVQLQPAVAPQLSGPEPVLSAFNAEAPSTLLKVSSVDGPITNPTFNVSDRLINVPPFEGAPQAIQKGTSVQISRGDTSFTSSVVLQNDRLFAVQTILGANGRPGLRWYEIGDPLTAPMVLDSGIISPPGLDVYFGSIAVNPLGEVVIGFTGSGPDNFASAYAVAGVLDGDTLTFGDPILLKAGEAPYELGGNPARWGDYSATTYDPSDPSHFWTIQEWALGQFEWSTEISEINFGTQVVVPEPSSLLVLGMGLVGLVLLRGRAVPTQRRKNTNTSRP
jgi:hypothetical protein